VISHADEERIARLAEPLRGHTLRAGDSLLLEPRSGYVFERIPKAEVEELILEEVPDMSYNEIGGLGPQTSRSGRTSCRTCTRTCSASTSFGRPRRAAVRAAWLR